MADELLAGTVSAQASASAVGMDATRELAATVDAIALPAGFLEMSLRGTELPASGASGAAPGSTIAFELYGTGVDSRVWDFDDSLIPPELELCTPANGYTESTWNDGTDQWDTFDDGADDVLRAQGKATALFLGSERAMDHSQSFDIVARIRWYTGATGGIVQRVRQFGTYPKTTGGFWGAAAEIDSGGFRLVWYHAPTRSVRATSAFSPVSGTWYWLRLRMQTGAWSFDYRGKYWTGTRANEPSSWTLAWEDDGFSPEEPHQGIGLRCHAGTLYFDDFEVVGELDPLDTAKLTVEVNSRVHSLAKGTLRIEPFAERCRTGTGDPLLPAFAQDWRRDLRGYVPDRHRWTVEVNAQEAFAADGDQTVVVKWDGSQIETWDFETLSIWNPWPDEEAAGDPARIGSFFADTDEIIPAGRRFSWIVEIFLEIMGGQDFKFSMAPVGWRSYFEEFRWIAIAIFYIPVDGNYIIAHPVLSDFPASLVPGELKEITIPALVVPKGSIERPFPASLVVQGYRRTDTVAGVVVGLTFFYRGKASGIVGEELLERIKSSGITLQINDDNELEIHVQDEETFQALQDLGVSWT